MKPGAFLIGLDRGIAARPPAPGPLPPVAPLHPAPHVPPPPVPGPAALVVPNAAAAEIIAALYRRRLYRRRELARPVAQRAWNTNPSILQYEEDQVSSIFSLCMF